ncbi:hypothetical protein M2109_000845 [Paenibacillus sp. PastH-3]|nr:hypothetical protein [Paenibacillus sp. PastH-4]MDH6442756.1 hypothetical protein [Paenibacillus sp. PastF-4]MDH6526534.1 hypothetical protein [Paenibacillus sp. PastH-3]
MAGGVLFSNCSDSVALISMIPLVLSHYRTQLQLFAQMRSFSAQIKGNKSYTVRNFRKMGRKLQIGAIGSDTIKF